MKAKTIIIIAIVMIAMLLQYKTLAQNSLYDINTVQKIEIFFDDEDWDYQLDTAKIGAGGYKMVSMKINGESFDSVGVKFKGNSSYDSTYKKNPWNISLDEFKKNSYDGYKSLKLANIYGDPSMVREAVAYNILSNYMASPKANFTELYINDEYVGLYTNTEPINKAFCTEYFGSKSNTFFECSPIIVPTPTVKGNLRYASGDSNDYMIAYELKSTEGWADLLNLCDVVTNNPDDINEFLFIDEAIWMLAFDNILLNIDSYIGVFSQNYYLYKDDGGQFHPIIWDLNMSFGGFQHTGLGQVGMGTLPLASLPTLPLTLHEGDSYWPLVNLILSNPQYRRMYFAHAKTIYNEFLKNNEYRATASKYQELIADYVVADNNKLFTYEQFQNALDSTYKSGSLSIPGIANVMNARQEYLKNIPEFIAVQPEISNISAVNMNNYLFVSANIENANNVFLAYKSKNIAGEFSKIQMYSDADAGIFSANVPMSTLEDTISYYIYAENDDAGRFSPERAQHEFYSYNYSASHINNNSYNVQINSYPNPVSDRLYITLPNAGHANIKIYNILGNIVYGAIATTSDIEILLNNFHAGVYTLQIELDGKMLIKKILKI